MWEIQTNKSFLFGSSKYPLSFKRKGFVYIHICSQDILVIALMCVRTMFNRHHQGQSPSRLGETTHVPVENEQVDDMALHDSVTSVNSKASSSSSSSSTHEFDKEPI